MEIEFYKYQGAGNDFILTDNRDGRYSSLNYKQIAAICDRRFGVGADGFMMLESQSGYPFRMAFFNSDGMPGSMCGNGGRCICAFAHTLGLVEANRSFRFWSSDGEHSAIILSEINGQHIVQLKMRDVEVYGYDSEHNIYLIDTGSPHYIRFVDDCEKTDVVQEGKRIRFSAEFPHGTNVDFVEKMSDSIQVRTYERGVEDETYSCGTGVTAAAIAHVLNQGYQQEHYHIQILTKGGNLKVDFRMERNFKPADTEDLLYPSRFRKITSRRFTEIYLEGLAAFVFKGQLRLDD